MQRLHMAEVWYYTPVAIAGLHLATAAVLSGMIGLDLYRAGRQLGLSQSPALLVRRRSKLLPTFVALAGLSLLLAVFAGLSHAKLSYQTWADGRGIGVPNSFPEGLWVANDSTPGIQLARWLSETPIYMGIAEILTERENRFWWAQQLDLATVSWGMLLAIEGHRLRIPHLWAYAVLAQTVSLPYAQNLFYLAAILRPSLKGETVSRPGGWLPSKPSNWSPHPAILFGCLLLSYGVILQLPYAVGTDSFIAWVISLKMLAFAPLAIRLLPERLGGVYANPRDAYDAYTMLFQLSSLASGLLFGKSTIIALRTRQPDSHLHRHSASMPSDKGERLEWARATTAVGKLLASTSDHPVVAAAGRDVLLCALSLGLWAAACTVDVENMLKSGVPFYEIATAASVKEPLHLAVGGEPGREGEYKQPASIASGRKRRPPRLRIMVLGEESHEQSPECRGSSNSGSSHREETLKYGNHPSSAELSPLPVEGKFITGESSLEWESAALAWGLTCLAGLGAGCAAVFGGECITT